MLFNDLSIIEPILKALAQEGYTQPTPIQQQAIPAALQGRDILGCAQTGTGKTAAFAIPIIQQLTLNKLKDQRKQVRAIILTPTRELAIQIAESFAVYGKYTQVHNTVIFGGVSQFNQTQQLQKGTDVIIATPGRLLDLMDQGFIHLNQLQHFVLDEADRMLDMGFINDVKNVIAKLPSKKQTLFFSATMPPEIASLANALLKNPEQVTVTPVSSTVEIIDQSIFQVSKENKKALLLHLLQEENIKNALVFTRTKHGADKVAKDLNRNGIRAEALHGNKSQNARQNALNNFKNNKCRVLVATEIAARGIDIDKLSHVINFDLPNIPESYVHRIGRTGRAGLSGKAISFCDHEEHAYLKDIQKLTKQIIPVISEHPFHLHIAGKTVSSENKTQSANGKRNKWNKLKSNRNFNRKTV